MIGDQHGLTTGHVSRHLPPASTVGLDIALLDIAQDFLLAHLVQEGVFELVTLKGGTALRKFFAGSQGRFSTDLDLAAAPTEAGDRRDLTGVVASYCNVTLGPFTFRSAPARDRHVVHVTSELGEVSQTIKLEVGPPCWLAPIPRPFVPLATHGRYGFPLPPLPSIALEEILAEKIARLTRQSTARDASDLVWIATTSPHSQFDRALVRRLAILKVWVDQNGLGDIWRPALHPQSFEPETWLRSRGNAWDDEAIGLLAHPAPTLTELNENLVQYYAWLAEITPEETEWSRGSPRDRGDVITALKDLPGGRLVGLPLY